MEFIDNKEYEHISFSKIESDIIFLKYAPRTKIDINMAKEIVANRLDYTSVKPIYALIDFTNVKLVTTEARDYMNNANGGMRAIEGGANNIAATVSISLYLKMNDSQIPAKLFTCQNDALGWLRNIRTFNVPLNKYWRAMQ